MTKMWVDPPSGWQYGFPKIFDPDGDLSEHEWLIENGYPEEDIYSTWFWVRQWPVAEKELVQDE